MVKLTGTNPDQVPTNAHLGTMAYQDKDNPKLGDAYIGPFHLYNDTGSVPKIETDENRIQIIAADVGYTLENTVFRPFGADNGTVDLGNTTSYWRDLYLSNSIKINGAAPLVTLTDTDAGANYAQIQQSGTNLYITGDRGDNANGSIVFRNGGTTVRMTISQAGEVQVTSGLLELDGNDIGGIQLLIADDAVASITPPRKGGFMFITMGGDQNYPSDSRSGLIYYDTGLSPYARVQTSSGISSNLDATQALNLTGTTGVDGNVTVSCHSGFIQIENRQDFGYDFQITFL